MFLLYQCCVIEKYGILMRYMLIKGIFGAISSVFLSTTSLWVMRVTVSSMECAFYAS